LKRQPDDRGSELRALFFESANELLQALMKPAWSSKLVDG